MQRRLAFLLFAGSARFKIMAMPGGKRGVRGARVRRAAWSPVLLSLAEVRESGRPAFFFDYQEALVFWDDQLFDLHDWSDALQTGADPPPLPARRA